MNKDFLDTIYLFACGAKGAIPSIEREYNFEEIFNYSVTQNIWQTVFLAVNSLKDKKTDIINENLFNNWKLQALSSLSQNMKRNFAINNMLLDFEKMGIDACILKGDSVAQIYFEPNCRVSGDVDILILKKQEEKIFSYLRDKGIEINPRGHISHHSSFYHPIAGLVELHTEALDEMILDVWFDKQFYFKEPYQTIKTADGRSYKTLGYTDNALFLFFHCIGHFLSEGIGIRAVFDVVLYLKAYKDKIDFNRFNEMIKSLRYDKFLESIYAIAVEYLDFSKDDFPEYKIDKAILEEILEDIKNGGSFGYNDKNRKNFMKFYNKARFNALDKYDYESYMSKRSFYTKMSLIFPKKDVILKKYPYAKKNIIFLLFAYIHRIFYFIFKLLKKEKELNSYERQTDFTENEAVERRLEMIKKLNMI